MRFRSIRRSEADAHQPRSRTGRNGGSCQRARGGGRTVSRRCVGGALAECLGIVSFTKPKIARGSDLTSRSA